MDLPGQSIGCLTIWPFTPKCTSDTVVAERIEYVSRQSFDVPFNEAWLADEVDVETYLAALRQAFLQAIKDKRRIQIWSTLFISSHL